MAADHHHEVDAVTGTATTGHEWDGIKELNTPLPRWWLNVLYACIAWAIAYSIAYPAWPLISNHTRGVLGYSSRADVAVEVAALKAKREAQGAGLAAADLAAIKANPTLLNLALAQGRAAFADNCAPCHGIGGAGAKGYPNLNDDDWLWDGTLEGIHTALKNGIRISTDADTRISAMPAFGRDGILKREEIRSAASYVVALTGKPTEAGYDAALGKRLFAENCAACHGDDGKGKGEVGAPNLTDAIALYGADLESVTETIRNSRAGVMPGWANRLDAVTVKALALYVHSLGGGK